MSRSLEFCVSRAADSKFSNYSNWQWDDIIEVDAIKIFDERLQGERKWTLRGKAGEDSVEINIELTIDPDSDFDYFTSSSSTHDGTLLFIYENIEICVHRIITAQTYNLNKRMPQNGDTIHYTVGNFIVGSEYDMDGTKFAPNDKKWMRERTTVMLPIKVEIV